jgi:hypothetical protein
VAGQINFYVPFFWRGSQLTVLDGVNGWVSAVDQGKLAMSRWDIGAALYDVADSQWTALAPAGSTSSSLQDADSGIQVGSATFGGVDTPGYWSGSSDSFVALDVLPGKFGGAIKVHENLIAGTMWTPGSSDRRWVAWDSTSGQMWDLAAPWDVSVNWISAAHVDALGRFNVYGSGYTWDGAQVAVHWQYAPVPEPGTMAALGLGLALLARRARRR